MLCLGIESTAHTFGVGISDEKAILANIKDTYTPPAGFGIRPREAATHHADIVAKLLNAALAFAHVNLADVDVIAFAQGPGLPPCLRIGAVVARALALKLDKPILGVNHCIGHIEIGRLATEAEDPVTLYVSGGNTQVLAFVQGRYRLFGETLDIAIGNALDMFARAAGLGHPGGPRIEELAKEGTWTKMPYVVKGMDLSFSGIVTEAIRKLKAGAKLEDICFSLQESSFAMLTEVVERAVAHTGKQEVLLTGGVAANARLQQMLRIMCEERGARFYVCPAEYAGDCGAMIAWTGLLAHRSGQKQTMEQTKINRFWRTDDVEVTWR
jgi:universal protein Kae1